MTADDATMNIIICIHVFLLKTLFRGFQIHLYLIGYLTHEGANSHMTSVLVYLLTS